MLTLNQLRTNLTEQQRAVLTATWRYYLDKDKWIFRRALHVGCGGKATVRDATACPILGVGSSAGAALVAADRHVRLAERSSTRNGP
jgi:hypothetical protein